MTDSMDVFVDDSARCEAREVGSGTRVLGLARIGPDVVLGDNCVVGEQAVLTGSIQLAESVDVQAGARLYGPIRVGPGVGIGMNAVLAATDPASGVSEITLGRDSKIGANAAVLPGVVVGRGAVVKPGSVVTENVPANAIVSGNPARIVAYVDSGHEATVREVVMPSQLGTAVMETAVRGVSIHGLTTARDLRGSLTAAEFTTLPFTPRRLFTVYAVSSESVRGSHAHKECSQFLVCLAGRLSCLVDDGSAREEIRLTSSEVGLHIPPLIWGTQWKYSRDAVLLALASHAYDPADYIRDYEEFLVELERRT